ncbi:nuclear transport factor 2 family protein [Pedobacter caeni]|uniref:Putative lumazine-binding n=1 Tax=Pedobacter caeni TaxID=288992 RepID=A0A1M4W9R7_9SPHI|nr:nuclear transport factor 2 family protein [Pedobacter caeni]SHE77702.1 Putative lumazine-binding [Pedobacter caeni]
MKLIPLFILFIVLGSLKVQGQTAQDSLDIKRVALAYIESQHNPNPKQMDDALHPRVVKRSVFKNKKTKRDYISEFSAENLVILAESYNTAGDKFPKTPRKDIKLLDISALTASVKLIADEWIDYMHIVKTNGEWKIINVLWQYNKVSEHQ